MPVDSNDIEWLSAAQLDRSTDENALARLGHPVTPPFLFTRLPMYVASSKLSPSAKLVFAEIATSSFGSKLKEKTVRFEYFKGYSAIARRTGLARGTVYKAIKELKNNGWLWLSEIPASASKRARKFYELQWTGDVDSLNDADDLAGSTLEPGPLTTTIFRHCKFAPIYSTRAEGKGRDGQSMLLRIYLAEMYPKTVTLDLIVFGYVVFKAQPVLFRSLGKIAEDLGMTRHTIKASLDRLYSCYLIGRCDDNTYYLNANPIYAAKLDEEVQNWCVNLINTIKEPTNG